jgi:hypothetical protein
VGLEGALIYQQGLHKVQTDFGHILFF